MVDPITLIGVIVGGAGVAQLIQSVGGYKAGPHTPEQYAKAGAEYMDKTMEILLNPTLSGAIPPDARAQMFVMHEDLQISRKAAEDVASAIFKSLLHYSQVKGFYNDTRALHAMALESSNRACTAAGKQAALAEMNEKQGHVENISSPNAAPAQTKPVQGTETARIAMSPEATLSGHVVMFPHPLQFEHLPMHVITRDKSQIPGAGV